MIRVDFEIVKSDFQTGKYISRYTKSITEKTANKIMCEKVKECGGHLKFLGEIVDEQTYELQVRQYEIVDYNENVIYTYTLMY